MASTVGSSGTCCVHSSSEGRNFGDYVCDFEGGRARRGRDTDAGATTYAEAVRTHAQTYPPSPPTPPSFPHLPHTEPALASCGLRGVGARGWPCAWPACGGLDVPFGGGDSFWSLTLRTGKHLHFLRSYTSRRTFSRKQTYPHPYPHPPHSPRPPHPDQPAGEWAVWGGCPVGWVTRLPLREVVCGVARSADRSNRPSGRAGPFFAGLAPRHHGAVDHPA